MILVSACLIGIDCKYNGKNNTNKEVIEFLRDKRFVITCPEQLGGMTTPRNPSEILGLDGYEVIQKDAKVISNDNIDVTDNFTKGAYETLKIAQLYNCKKAILKEGSPSCGCSYIYDGTFTGKKKNGVGVTTALLRSNNIEVISEKEIKSK